MKTVDCDQHFKIIRTARNKATTTKFFFRKSSQKWNISQRDIQNALKLSKHQRSFKRAPRKFHTATDLYRLLGLSDSDKWRHTTVTARVFCVTCLHRARDVTYLVSPGLFMARPSIWVMARLSTAWHRGRWIYGKKEEFVKRNILYVSAVCDTSRTMTKFGVT